MIHLCLLIFSSGSTLYSQSDVFQKTGLLTDYMDVYSVYQDSNGYYWIGSNTSLYCYDGVSLTHIYPEEGTDDPILTITQDSNNNIWFGTLDGKLVRVNKNGYLEAGFDSLSIKDEIVKIIQGDEKHLWIFTNTEGAYFVDLTGKDISKLKARRFGSMEGLGINITGACRSNNGRIVCLSENGLRVFDDELEKFRSYSGSHSDIDWCLAIDKLNNCWVGTNNGILKFREAPYDTIYPVDYGAQSNRVLIINVDSRSRVWAATSANEIMMKDGEETEIFDFGGKIFDIFEDLEGNIIIAGSSGLRIFGENTLKVFDLPGNIPDKSVFAFAEDRSGAIWLGTSAGVGQILPGNPMNLRLYNGEATKFLRYDSKGTLWICGERGISKYDGRSDRFILQPEINLRLSAGEQVLAMEFDRKRDILFLGTDRGLIVAYENNVRSGKTLSQDCVLGSVSVMYCDRQNNMWIGSQTRTQQAGLFKFDCDSGECNQISGTAGLKPTAMVLDSAGTLWIGTNNKGLFYCKDDIASPLGNQPDIIKYGQITALGLSPRNELFIGTNSGLWMYDLKSGKFTCFSRFDGLIDDNINPGGLFFDSKGQGWIATKNGVNILPAVLNFSEKKSPIPVIRSIVINGKAVDPDSVYNIGYSSSQLTFNVGFTSFTDPVSVHIKAKLSGLDREWVDYGQGSAIKYPSLPSGKYLFSVMTETDKGGVSEVRNFTFRILPPWWRSVYAVILYIVLLGFLVFIYMRIRERKLIRANQALETAVKERTAYIENQKDEIKEQRDRITGQRDLLKAQNELIANQKKDLTDSIQYAKRIQSSLVPPSNYLNDVLDDYFVFYRPKDIVSGDFYWMEKQDSSIIIVGADCTGHGVPGALISMLGITFLEDIVKVKGIKKPNEVLDHLRERIVETFKQVGSDNHLTDGMDIAVISLDPENSILEYSGAKNPLYLVKNGTLHEFKADRFPVSYHDEMPPFTNHRVKIEKGDSVYIFSDGFADQFGGPENKKFRYSRFRELLSGLNGKRMLEQGNIISASFDEWKGDHDQVDDVLIIGIGF